MFDCGAVKSKTRENDVFLHTLQESSTDDEDNSSNLNETVNFPSKLPSELKKFDHFEKSIAEQKSAAIRNQTEKRLQEEIEMMKKERETYEVGKKIEFYFYSLSLI